MRSVGLGAVFFETLCHFVGCERIFCSCLGGAGRSTWRDCGLLPDDIYFPPMNGATPKISVERMNDLNPRRFVVARVVLSVVIVLLIFAVVIPNCVVPATATTPQHFIWGGLAGPCLVSAVLLFFIWHLR